MTTYVKPRTQTGSPDLPPFATASGGTVAVCSHLSSRELIVCRDGSLFTASPTEVSLALHAVARLGLGLHGDAACGWPCQWWAESSGASMAYECSPAERAWACGLWNDLNGNTMPWPSQGELTE